MKFFKLIFCLLLITMAHQSFSQNAPDCSIMKKGKFIYLDFDDKTRYIEMDGNHQIEKSENNPYVIESSVEWVNDCTYIMTMTRITIPNFPFGPGDKMKVEITKIDGDIISFTSTVNGNLMKGRFKKVGD